MPVLIGFGVFFLIVLIWFVANYNALVRLKLHVKEAWAQTDTELKRRYDLIPNLVETVKAYAAHERQTLEAVVEARNKASESHGSVQEHARDENNFVSSLNRMMVVVEDYPELKSDKNFMQLQQELVNTEDRIQAARRFYNANVRDLNTRVQVVPSNIIAGMFGFTTADYFEVEEAARAAIKVDMS